jgi:hypothetical protein
MGLLEGFVYGVVGGGLAELLGLFRLRHSARGSFPEWLKSPFYWIVTLLMILSGGLLVIIYMRSNLVISAIIAVNIGASAPLIISTFTSHIPKVSMGPID